MNFLEKPEAILEEPKRIMDQIPISKKFFKKVKKKYGEIPVKEEIYIQLIKFLNNHFEDDYYIQVVLNGILRAYETDNYPKFTGQIKTENDLDKAHFFFRQATDQLMSDIESNSISPKYFINKVPGLKEFYNRNGIERTSSKMKFYEDFPLSLIGQKNKTGGPVHLILHPYEQEDDDSFYKTNLNFIFINNDGELADIKNPIQDLQSAYHPLDSFGKLGKQGNEIIYTKSPVSAMKLFSKFGHDTAIWFSYEFNSFNTVPEGVNRVTICADNDEDFEHAKHIVDSYEGTRKYVRRILIEKPYN